jgi:ketosteroid isomerase-like protein
MAGSNVEVARSLFDRFASGSIEAALELMSDDLVVVVPPSMSAEPDTYEGHEGVRRYFDGFDGQIEDVRFEPLELIDEGERVIASLRLTGRGTTSGIEVEQRAASVLELRGGKVVRIESHPDVETARASSRPSP